MDIDNISNNQCVVYNSLKIGECFKYDGIIYMKTESVHIGNVLVDAINIATGYFDKCFDDNDVVTVVERF